MLLEVVIRMLIVVLAHRGVIALQFDLSIVVSFRNKYELGRYE